MDLKFAIVLAVCLYHFTPSLAKPTPNLGELHNGDLAEKFVEFLEQDKQFKELLSRFDESSEEELVRRKRQATNNMEDDDDILMDNVPKQQDGFMDRAAKFMMELLQRFLRWINTD